MLTGEALEVGLEVGHMSSRALALTAGVLEAAAIELNNSGVTLPEEQWRDVCDRVAWLTRLAEAYAAVAVENDLHDASI